MSLDTVNQGGAALITGLTATGSSQATALQLANRTALNEITTAASSTGVVLPAPKSLGMTITIANQGANTLSVYPQLGGTIDNGTANAAVTLAPGKTAAYEASSLTNWYTVATTASAGGSVTSAAIDSAFGSTQGDILYRNATVWTVLAPGTAGQALESGGAAANPSWAEVTGPRPFTALLGIGANIATGTNAANTYAICSFSGTFTRWDIAIPAANQPSGASLVLDVYKSSNQGSTWTSLWATNTGNRPTVTTGTNSGGGTAFDTTTFSAGDWLRFDVVTAGGGAVQNVALTLSSRMNQ
jgi:hypothetical protein